MSSMVDAGDLTLNPLADRYVVPTSERLTPARLVELVERYEWVVIGRVVLHYENWDNQVAKYYNAVCQKWNAEHTIRQSQQGSFLILFMILIALAAIVAGLCWLNLKPFAEALYSALWFWFVSLL